MCIYIFEHIVLPSTRKRGTSTLGTFLTNLLHTSQNISVFKIISKQKLSGSERNAMFLLHQFVTDCNMLHAISKEVGHFQKNISKVPPVEQVNHLR